MEEKKTITRKELADAIRVLSMDAVEKARSGHPGAPMGMADMAEALWNGFLKHNPTNPHWPDRDRVVLSNGHASMLLYSALHLSGYELSLEDIKNFRQLHSKTPGHPETQAIALIGEIGGDAEERAAEYIADNVTKPVVAYVAGFTAPEGRTMGHAGAIVSGSSGTAQAKKAAFEAVGVTVGRTPSETAELMRRILRGK